MPDSSTQVVIPLPELTGAVGTMLGPSAWHTVDQQRVDGFADATEDHQWIHVDPARAAGTLFGGTIAHGYLTLALAPALLDEIVAVDDCGMVINYGANKIRFPAPLPVGSRVRMRAEIISAESAKDGSTQVAFGLTFEAEDAERPCCVAEIVFRYYPPSAGAGSNGSRPTHAVRLATPAQVAAAWMRWLSGTYALWATTLERSRRAALDDPASLVPPLAEHVGLAARFWADVLAPPPR